MNVRKTNKRKAISPVLATVILIAITLVAGVAIAGFAFGLFGSLSATANVQESVEGCTATGGYCTINLYNTGSASASATSCTIYGVTGTLQMPAGTPVTSVPIGAGVAASAAIPVSCAVTTQTLVAGTSVTGQIGLSNGISLTFTVTAGA